MTLETATVMGDRDGQESLRRRPTDDNHDEEQRTRVIHKVYLYLLSLALLLVSFWSRCKIRKFFNFRRVVVTSGTMV